VSTDNAPEPTTNARRYEMIEQLDKLGPRLTTKVVVNGRSLLLDAAIRLVENLPEDAKLERRGVLVTIDPDPFASSPNILSALSQAQPAEERSRMLTRLIERQEETDRLAEAERMNRSWRNRLARLLIGNA
jgi:hypothetical protein